MDKDFYSLLETISDNYTFNYSFLDKETRTFSTVSCNCLTMLDVSRLIDASLHDSALQVRFYTALSHIFQNSLKEKTDTPLNIVDRLLYMLQIRSNSISPTKVFTEEDYEISVDFNKIATNLQNEISLNIEWFLPKTFTEKNTTIRCNIPSVDTDLAAGEQFYKYHDANLTDPEDVKTFIGQNFIIELVKSISSLTIDETTLDFATIPFDERIKVIEQVPAVLMQGVIDYNQKYKNVINECLSVEDFILPINGALFLE